jgi:hypothetical protein
MSTRSLRCLVVLATVLATWLAWAAPAEAIEEFDRYAVESVSAELSTTQAGAHADFTPSFQLAEKAGEPYGLTRDIEVALPPGLIGNPQGIPRCSSLQLGKSPEESECPVSSQVGISEVTLGGANHGTFTEPIYNMPAPGGDIVARFGLFAGPYPTVLDVRVDPVDYSLVASIEGAPAAASLISASTTLWGVPAASSHNSLRLTPEEALHGDFPPGGRPAGIPPAPFLSNPTSCSTVREISVTATSYQRPGSPSTKTAPFPAITGCESLHFDPSFTALPTSSEAASASGLDATLTVPQNEAPNGLATSALRAATVVLPEGMTINPAAGDGLAACSLEDVGFGTDRPSNCPEAAKIGAVELVVPALEHVLNGAVFQRTPEPGHLFRFWLVTDEQGVHLKLPAEIETNPLTGQLTTVFNGLPNLGGNPELPFSELRLHVFGGPQAPLATPASCGTYQTHFQFSPWSGQAPAEGNTAMKISSGCEKDRFHPRLAAGSTNSFAGAFAPFAMTLIRRDGEANPRVLSVHLPKGLLAKLGGVPLCADAQAASGACSADSQIGTLTAAVGVGAAPLWVPQPGKLPTAVYLAGPYKGAPYSIVSVVPAQAGPFDLGTVVNRAAIEVDPETGLATITTDPLPQILEGVPVAYRTVHVDVTRPDFMINPTSCDPKKVTATVTASNGATASPETGYQATNCIKLHYSPKLRLTLKGSVKRTGNPAVKAVLTQPPHQANTAAATVLLPPSEFIDQSHINSPCTRVQFNAGACPKRSILGTAEARTPLLDQPLKGPVYFRSNGGERELPDIVADLHGPIHITLVGWIDSVRKKGTESSQVRTRFVNVPDAPVTKFTISLYGGKRSLIENSSNLCKGSHRAKVRLAAQNGRVKTQNAPVKTSCGKRKR